MSLSAGGDVSRAPLTTKATLRWPSRSQSACLQGSYKSYALVGLDSGGGIRTRDLRVMSPTSYQTAPPRVAPYVLAKTAHFGSPRGGKAEIRRSPRDPLRTSPVGRRGRTR